MSDPLSFIALGAGIGGVASKFAEKAWETAERWLTSKFGEHSEISKEIAHKNAASFLNELAQRIQKLEESGHIKAENVLKEQQHPQFSATLQNAIIRSAQTDNNDKHVMLAELIAHRLSSESESILSLASQMAVDAIALTTKRQLELLALCSFLEEIKPKTPINNYCEWLDVFLDRLGVVEFYEIDALHLVALSCITYDPTSEKSLAFVLGFKFGIFDEDAFSDLKNIDWLQVTWDIGLAGVKLTSVGSLVGSLAFNHITGIQAGMPKWYGG